MTDPKSEIVGLAERGLFENIVHGLRMQGWSRIEAEGEALNRIDRVRATLKEDENG